MDLHPLLAAQEGLATRRQLRELGVSIDKERAEIRAGRWQLLSEVVVATHNGPLTLAQRNWLGVLSAPPPVGLAGLTAMARLGVTGFATADVHIIVPRGTRAIPTNAATIVVHESRRFTVDDLLPREPPTTSLERATIDAAVWSDDIQTATRVIVAPIQQRRTTATRLREALTAAGKVKSRAILLPFLADLEGGAEALSEVAFLRWCRRHGFPEPRLRVRLDRNGRRRYLDAVFDLPTGVLFVEIDGGVHLTLATRWLDTMKDNDAVIAGEPTLRFPSIAIYCDHPVALRQLEVALRGVRPTWRYNATSA